MVLRSESCVAVSVSSCGWFRCWEGGRETCEGSIVSDDWMVRRATYLDLVVRGVK